MLLLISPSLNPSCLARHAIGQDCRINSAVPPTRLRVESQFARVSTIWQDVDKFFYARAIGTPNDGESQYEIVFDNIDRPLCIVSDSAHVGCTIHEYLGLRARQKIT